MAITGLAARGIRPVRRPTAPRILIVLVIPLVTVDVVIVKTNPQLNLILH